MVPVPKHVITRIVRPDQHLRHSVLVHQIVEHVPWHRAMVVIINMVQHHARCAPTVNIQQTVIRQRHVAVVVMRRLMLNILGREPEIIVRINARRIIMVQRLVRHAMYRLPTLVPCPMVPVPKRVIIQVVRPDQHLRQIVPVHQIVRLVPYHRAMADITRTAVHAVNVPMVNIQRTIIHQHHVRHAPDCRPMPNGPVQVMGQTVVTINARPDIMVHRRVPDALPKMVCKDQVRRDRPVHRLAVSHPVSRFRTPKAHIILVRRAAIKTKFRLDKLF